MGSSDLETGKMFHVRSCVSVERSFLRGEGGIVSDFTKL